MWKCGYMVHLCGNTARLCGNTTHLCGNKPPADGIFQFTVAVTKKKEYSMIGIPCFDLLL